ncbi:aminotransferase class V-fold PLP-dependent enzyme [Desulfitobacterium chlororespirans]|uniref:cysteine desulfurase n=1 Tax=Desulfitobacterium chlororespirans DSM 11544 TaxID=1121395 RepID=A0A1M7SHI4_9FIRM|nr:aminotransferase class V-fold PLP-dependent enzyme [Desulfitobacterium chlororespirans]SHN57925.1 cysteine desulfurases, SufSfamily [Desulfitobacterium chlororespirans DSM 11544]
MIRETSHIPQTPYHKYQSSLDDIEPAQMDKITAVVLATDVRKIPVTVELGPDQALKMTEAEIKAFHRKAKDIDQKNPAPRPLQIYDGGIIIHRVIQNILEAGIRDIYLLVENYADEIAAAVQDLAVQLIPYDRARVDQINATHKFEIKHYSLGQLTLFKELLQQSGGDSCLLLAGDQVQLQVRHIKKMRAAFEANPQGEIFTSYAEWRGGTPILLSKSLLAKVTEKSFHSLAIAGISVPIRLYEAESVLLGEDKAYGPVLFPEGYEGFVKNIEMPALRAVRKARAQPSPAEIQAARRKGLKPSEFVTKAKTCLDKIDQLLAKQPVEDLAYWDNWAKRNRKDFPLLSSLEHGDSLVYLDSAATTQRPYQVMEAGNEFVRSYHANIWRGYYQISGDATAQYEAAREKIAHLINGEAHEIIFTGNTSASCNLVAQAWGLFNLKKGDLILVALSEHHSNLMPWQFLGDYLGVALKYIPIDPSGRLDRHAYKELLKEGPKLVCVAQISNVLGLLNPIKAMTRLAHEAGAVVLVDAAQSIQHIKIDVKDLDADFLAFSGHKIYGPTGIGVLWAAERIHEQMRPVAVGGGEISEVGLSGFYHRRVPYCFELGTPPIEQVIGMGAAAEYLEDLGLDNVEKHSRAMSQYALLALSTLDSACVRGDHSREDGGLGLISFTNFGVGNSQPAFVLGHLGVCVRGNTHCAIHFMTRIGIYGTTRVGMGVYTTKEDIEALVFALSIMEEKFKGSDYRP